MLRQHRKLRVRVSDRLAAVCAILLLVTTLSGKDESAPSGNNPATMAAAEWEAAIIQAEEEVTAGRSTSNRGLNISRLIFRHN